MKISPELSRECHFGCGHNLNHRRAGLPQHGAKALPTELAVCERTGWSVKPGTRRKERAGRMATGYWIARVDVDNAKLDY